MFSSRPPILPSTRRMREKGCSRSPSPGTHPRQPSPSLECSRQDGWGDRQWGRLARPSTYNVVQFASCKAQRYIQHTRVWTKLCFVLPLIFMYSCVSFENSTGRGCSTNRQKGAVTDKNILCLVPFSFVARLLSPVPAFIYLFSRRLFPVMLRLLSRTLIGTIGDARLHIERELFNRGHHGWNSRDFKTSRGGKKRWLFPFCGVEVVRWQERGRMIHSWLTDRLLCSGYK